MVRKRRRLGLELRAAARQEEEEEEEEEQGAECFLP
jgi:hypothetical protein